MDRSFSKKFFARLFSPKNAGLKPRFLRLLSEDRSVNVQILIWANVFLLPVIALSGDEWRR